MRTLTVALLAVAACSEPAVTPDAGPSPDKRLEVSAVVEQPLDVRTRLQGELMPFEAVAIHARVPGFVEELNVDRGSLVKRGQPLARLTAPELYSQRAEAESKMRADESTFERLRAASATPGAVAKHDLEVAEATLKSSKARLQTLQTLEGYQQLRAPFDGTVTERNVHVGALVGPPSGPGSVPLLRIEQLSKLRLTVAVPEAMAGVIPDGGTIEFSVQAWPDTRFHGTLSRVSHTVEQRTRTMPVELDVDNADGRLAPGMLAQVYWPLTRGAASLFVPASAVVQTADRIFVDRVKDGTVQQVPVTRGVAMGSKVEVFGPLAPGELVLVRGSEELKTGAAVKTRPAGAPDAGR